MLGAPLFGANLCGANLREADLRGADLTYANLCGADLSYANLRGADLLGATLGEADLTQANLGYANLRGTDLSERDLTPSGLALIAHAARKAPSPFLSVRRSRERSPLFLTGAGISPGACGAASIQRASPTTGPVRAHSSDDQGVSIRTASRCELKDPRADHRAP